MALVGLVCRGVRVCVYACGGLFFSCSRKGGGGYVDREYTPQAARQAKDIY